MNTQKPESITKPRGGCCCASKSAIASGTRSSGSASSDLPLQQLQVRDANNDGCVRSIEQALHSVTGVTEACMDLATGVASVIGVVEPNALIEALDRAGFTATAIK